MGKGFVLSCVFHILFNPLRAVRRARFGNTFSNTLALLSGQMQLKPLIIQSASRSPPGQFSTALVPFLSRLSLLGVTFGGLEMQLSGPKTDFGAQGAP